METNNSGTDKTKNDKDSLWKIFKGLFKSVFFWVTVTVLISLIPLFIYYFYFQSTEISNDTNLWGNFGSYLGGSIGIIVGAINSILIYITFQKQVALIEDNKKDSVLFQFENTFFNLLENYRNTLNDVFYLKTTYAPWDGNNSAKNDSDTFQGERIAGRDGIAILKNKFDEYITKHIWETFGQIRDDNNEYSTFKDFFSLARYYETEDKKINEHRENNAYETQEDFCIKKFKDYFYSINRSKIGYTVYTNNLFYTLKYILESGIDERNKKDERSKIKDFINIFKNQLSGDEISLCMLAFYADKDKRGILSKLHELRFFDFLDTDNERDIYEWVISEIKKID